MSHWVAKNDRLADMGEDSVVFFGYYSHRLAAEIGTKQHRVNRGQAFDPIWPLSGHIPGSQAKHRIVP